MNVTAKPRILTALEVERHREGVLGDARCPGLRLVATPNAATDGGTLKRWIYRYRRRDRTRGQIKLGEYPRMSLAQARIGRPALAPQPQPTSAHGQTADI